MSLWIRLCNHTYIHRMRMAPTAYAATSAVYALWPHCILILFYTCPPLCAGAQLPMPA